MTKRSQEPIYRRIILVLFLAAALPLLLFGAISLIMAERFLREGIEEIARSELDQLTERTENSIRELNLSSYQLAGSFGGFYFPGKGVEIDWVEIGRFQKLVENVRLVDNRISSVLFISHNSNRLYASPQGSSTRAGYPDQDYLNLVLSEEIGSFKIIERNGSYEAIYITSYPFGFSNEEGRAILSTPLESLLPVIEEESLSRSFFLYLGDRYLYLGEKVEESSPQLAAQLDDLSVGRGTLRENDRIYVYKKTELTSLVYVIEIQTDRYLSNIRQFRVLALISSLGLLSIALAGLLLASRWLYTPIGEMKGNLEALLDRTRSTLPQRRRLFFQRIINDELTPDEMAREMAFIRIEPSLFYPFTVIIGEGGFHRSLPETSLMIKGITPNENLAIINLDYSEDDLIAHDFSGFSGISRSHQGIKEFKSAVLEARRARDFSLVRENDNYVFFDETLDSLPDYSILNGLNRTVINHLQENRDQLKPHLDNLNKAIIEQTADNQTVIQLYGEILQELYHSMVTRDLDPPTLLGLPYARIYSELTEKKSLRELCHYFFDLIEKRDMAIKQFHRGYYDIAIKEILEFVDDNLSQGLSVPLLADKMRVSPAYFSRIFKRYTGYSFLDYLTEKRILLARKKLKNTNNSVYKIGEETGYPNATYFIRVFKKKVGMTPEAYRKENK